MSAARLMDSGSIPVGEMIREVLRDGGVVSFGTLGSSMRPLIYSGSQLRIRGCPPEQLTVGDVVLLGKPYTRRKYIVHRVIRVAERDGRLFFITRGDSSSIDVAPFPAAECLGRIVGVVTGERDYDLEHGFWRASRRFLAAYSRLAGFFAGEYNPHRERRPAWIAVGATLGRKAFRGLMIVHVLLGKWLTARPAPPLAAAGPGLAED
jgi:hypothetical protein